MRRVELVVASTTRPDERQMKQDVDNLIHMESRTLVEVCPLNNLSGKG